MTSKAAFALALFGLASISADSPKLTIPKLPATPVSSVALSKHAAPFSRLPVLARGPISATLGRDIPSYRMHTQKRGFRAENARNGLTADFALRGIEVKSSTTNWTMALRGYGYGTALKLADPAVPKASLNRVEYERGALTEWYVNGPAGLEQGFTIKERPGNSGGEPLTIAMALSGDFRAALDRDQKSLSLSGRDHKPTLSYAGLMASDSLGRLLPAWLELRGTNLWLRVEDKSATYPLIVDPIVQLAKLTASDGMPGDQMGISVGISGKTIVVGAQSATVGSNAGQGAAYVFVKSSLGWVDATETAKLTSSDGQAGDGFGGSVGISGNTIVVGACNQSGMCNGQGKVYVFLKPKTGWTTTSEFKAELTASDSMPNDGFSNMLSLSRDGNTIAVGAWGATVNGNPSEGAAYIFVRPRLGWESMHETAKLTEGHGAPYDDFGNVAISGDGATLFVGAIQQNVTTGEGTGRGKAYLFVRPATGWRTTSKFVARLTASDGVIGDGFGFCQTGAACISSDGTTVLASAPQFSVTSTGPGKAYIFVKPMGGWKTTSHFTAELTPSDGIPGEAFGWSPAVTNGLAVVGAVAASAAYVFVKPKNGWTTTSKFALKLTPADGSQGAFGFSTAIGGQTIVVGALNNPGGGLRPGATFVFGH
jgi:hypothetical protein